MKIKKFLREFVLTKGIYKLLYSIKNRKYFKEKKQKRKNIKRNGIKTIHSIQKILGKEKFFFDMGTLLGIIREGRLLGHDLDIDTGIFLDDEKDVERIRNLLLNNGCNLYRSFTIEGIGVVEDSFTINNIKFDVAYYRIEDNYDVTYLMYESLTNPIENGLNVVKLKSSHINEFVQIDFNGKKINVPKESEKYLAERYGENWRIPDKNYIYWKGPSTTPTDLVGVCIEY